MDIGDVLVIRQFIHDTCYPVFIYVTMISTHHRDL